MSIVSLTLLSDVKSASSSLGKRNSGRGHAIVSTFAIWKQKQRHEVYLRLLLLVNTIADGILGGVIIWEAQHSSPTEPLRPYYEYHNQLRLSECG